VSERPSGPDPLIGRIINDRFRIVSMIARGGMGKVYRAEQVPLGREVALKVLHPNYSGDSDPEFHKRFFLEASTTAKLTHPNTVSIFDYGRTEDDVYYIAMELLDGKTLHRALRESGPMEPARILHITAQICRSLREAHELGVIHRDLKPANIYLVVHGDESEFVKVLDFGLVKSLEDTGEELTQTGLFMGSPKYMSPEQIRGERVDGRADVYSLGVIMYEMLTGKVPFDRTNSVNILMAHVHESPPRMAEINPNVTVPSLLEQVVMKAMAKKPDDRYPSMDALLFALKEIADPLINPDISGRISLLSSGAFPASDAPLRESRPTPSAPISAHPPASKHRVSKLVGAVSIAVLASVGALAFQRRTAPELPAPDLASSPLPPAAPPNPETPPPPLAVENEPEPTNETTTPSVVEAPALRVRVTLRSTPPGAMVTVNGNDAISREYGPTPVDFEWVGPDIELGREVAFRFELPGHQDMTVIRRITEDTLDVSAELDVRTPTPRPRASRQGEAESSGGPVGPMRGYKLDPY
jgi:serine/threonine-protein kinase